MEDQPVVLSPEQIRAAAGVLLQVITSDRIKLRWGGMKREEIRQQLQAGVRPTGYRVDWIRTTKSAVVDALSTASKAFNLKYPHDRISAADMIDVLVTTTSQMQAAVQRSTKKEEGKD